MAGVGENGRKPVDVSSPMALTVETVGVVCSPVPFLKYTKLATSGKRGEDPRGKGRRDEGGMEIRGGGNGCHEVNGTKNEKRSERPRRPRTTAHRGRKASGIEKQARSA